MISIIVSSTASGFYRNMNVIRAFWSTSFGQTKQHSHVKVSSAVTTATCGHSIIPMQHANGAIKFAGALMCGLVSLAIVLLGHTYYPTASVALLICVFLQEVLLEDVPPVVRRDMVQHDGALAHFRAQTQQHLNSQFPDRWLGRGSSVSWSARSPDLNPLDFLLWGHLKEIVYRDPLTDMEDLTAKFYAAVTIIDADML
jgi:hypothetical protein